MSKNGTASSPRLSSAARTGVRGGFGFGDFGRQPKIVYVPSYIMSFVLGPPLPGRTFGGNDVTDQTAPRQDGVNSLRSAPLYFRLPDPSAAALSESLLRVRSSQLGLAANDQRSQADRVRFRAREHRQKAELRELLRAESCTIFERRY